MKLTHKKLKDLRMNCEVVEIIFAKGLEILPRTTKQRAKEAFGDYEVISTNQNKGVLTIVIRK